MDRDYGTRTPAHPLIGQVVGGRYHIVELIGEGGMGVVYKAEQRLGSTLRKVAVKTLHAELSRDPSITARFHREVGTVAQLEHPNTVRVYDFGSTDDGTLYIAMEFLDGRALNRVIETEGALEPRRVGNLIRQIAGSLDEAHRQGIVHRDLKPENVLLIERAGEKDVVKLVDFGIAARTESADREKEQKLTQQGMVLGTPPYMSPEQFTGKPLDARSDVYSLGIMTYEMLTGQLPFEADTAWQWATHHMTSQPRSFDDVPNGSRIPQGLRRTVLRALSKEPHERQSSAGQFHAELSAGLIEASAAPAQVNVGGKTEAMPQAPPLAMAATEGMPAALPRGPTAPAMAASAVLPPAPPRERADERRAPKYALAALAAILFVALGVAALSGGEGEGTAPPPLTRSPPAPTNSQTDAPGEGTPEPATAPDVAEEEEKDPVEEPPPERPKPRPKPSGSSTKSPATKPAATKPAATKPAAPDPTPTPAATPPQPAPTPTPPPQALPVPPAPAPSPTPSVDACAACAKAAQSGDIPTAGTLYAQCTNQAGKRQCANIVGQRAPRAAETAAFNQQCAQARLIIAAARQMGVAAGRLTKAEAACK